MGDIIGSMLSATEDNNQTALALADKFGYNLKFRPLTVLPFSSDRKLSAVTFEEMGTYMLGAPEYVLSDMGIRINGLWTRTQVRATALCVLRILPRI